MRELAVYGSGGFGREVAWLLSRLEGDRRYDVIGFVDDTKTGTVNDLPVLSFERLVARHPQACVAIGVGDPAAKRKLAEKCAQFAFPVISDPGVIRSERVSIGDGTIVCAGCILTVNIELGRHVHLNLDCTVGHDVVIGDFTTVAPGVHISGNVQIGSSVYIGTGANIINGTREKPLVIGDGCVIGAGACVTASTEPDGLYVGVPATLKRRGHAPPP